MRSRREMRNSANWEEKRVKKKTNERKRERELALPSTPFAFFFLRLLHDLNAWNYTQAPLANPPSSCCDRAPTSSMQCPAAVWTTFRKLQTLQLLNGGWREYGLFCSPWGQCLNNFVSPHNRRFMSQATGGERGILREAQDEVRRILAIPTLVSRFAQNAAFDCTLVFC